MKSLIPFGFGRNLPRLQDENFWLNWPNWEDLQKTFPAVDISETDKEVVVKADVPNVDPKDIDVRIENGNLIIQGKTEKEKETKEKNFYRRERSSGSFYRTLALPCAVDEAKISAKSKNGVLTVALPKKAKNQTQKKVKIEVEK